MTFVIMIAALAAVAAVTAMTAVGFMAGILGILGILTLWAVPGYKASKPPECLYAAPGIGYELYPVKEAARDLLGTGRPDTGWRPGVPIFRVKVCDPFVKTDGVWYQVRILSHKEILELMEPADDCGL